VGVDGEEPERSLELGISHLTIVAVVGPLTRPDEPDRHTGAMTDLDARYGRRPPVRPSIRRALVFIGVVILIGLAAGVAALYVAGRPPASMEIEGYTVVSAEQTTAVVEVTKPAGRTAACEVRALDKSLDLVGSVTVEAKGDAKRVRISVTVPTTTSAFGVRAGDCVLNPTS
jgi:Domain of unknown function (DUF4307)